MSKTVLCALDISNPDRDHDVLRQAARMADLDGAQLDVITVVPDFGMSVVGAFFDKTHHGKIEAEAKKQLKAVVVEELGADRAAKVRHVVATGKAYEEVLEVAEKDGADLIVIGAHKPDLKDYLLGPNASRVVRHATTSVYVVR